MLSGIVLQPERRRSENTWVPSELPQRPQRPSLPDDPLPGIIFNEHVSIFEDEIRIRDMIEFIVDTDIIQEYSVDTLEAIVDLLNSNARIAHLVVEGHASAEGDYTHNYDLAESRAQAIWEFFLAHGVAEERVSYRGFGEVKPLVEGEDEQALQKNRRVRFVITRQLPPEGPFPIYPRSQLLPWNAETVPVVQPAAPSAPEETPDPFELPSLEDEIGE